MLGLGVKNRDLSVYYVWIQIGKSYLGLRDKFAKTRLPHGAIWSQPDCPMGQFGHNQIAPRGNLDCDRIAPKIFVRIAPKWPNCPASLKRPIS